MLDEAQVMTAVDTALEAFGRLDVVQNNVGSVRLGGPEELVLPSGARPCRLTSIALLPERRLLCRTSCRPVARWSTFRRRLNPLDRYAIPPMRHRRPL